MGGLIKNNGIKSRQTPTAVALPLLSSARVAFFTCSAVATSEN